jgi:hypothetical protein
MVRPAWSQFLQVPQLLIVPVPFVVALIAHRVVALRTAAMPGRVGAAFLARVLVNLRGRISPWRTPVKLGTWRIDPRLMHFYFSRDFAQKCIACICDIPGLLSSY